MVKIYCINLERSKDRRSQMEIQIKDQNLEVEFFTGFDGRAMEITEEHMKERSSPGEYGCLMSHFSVWQDIVDKGHEMAIILEDDIELAPEFKTKIENLELPEKWDMIYLDHISPIYEGTENKDLNIGRSLCFSTYMISSECAKKLTQFDPIDYRGGVDVQVAQMPIKSYWAKESFSSHNGFIHSTISCNPSRIPVFHNTIWIEKTYGTIIAFAIIMCLLFYLKTRLLK